MKETVLKRDRNKAGKGKQRNANVTKMGQQGWKGTKKGPNGTEM